MYVCMVTHIARVWINRVRRLPMTTFVCFLPVYSGHHVRLGVPAESHKRRSHKISHPPSFYDAWLHFSRGGFSRSFPSSTVKSNFVYDLIVPRMLGISDLFKIPVTRIRVFFFQTILDYQVRWTYQPGSHRRKVTQDFSPTFLRRCVPYFFLAKRIQPFLFLGDREVEFFAERA